MGQYQSAYCNVGVYTTPPVTVNQTVNQWLTPGYYINDYNGPCNDASNDGVYSYTNTNKCINLSFDLQNCLNGIDDSCCFPAEEFRENGCEYNPALEYLTVSQTENGQAEWDAFSTALVPLCEAHLGRTFTQPPESNYQTYHRGCSITDMELEKKRLQAALEFSKPFQSAGDNSTNTFDLVDLQFKLHLWTTRNPLADVPYGVGKYQGLDGMTEYLALYWYTVNKGLWKPGAINSAVGAEISFSENSHELQMAGLADGYLADETVSYSGIKLTQTYSYNKCDFRLNSVRVHEDDQFAQLVEAYYKMFSLFDEWGRENICRYHEKYCRPNGFIQYDSFQDCMDYLDTVPMYSPQCMAEQKMLSGNSISCRAKHQFMLPMAPDKHCPHIGRDGDPNRNNIHHKCEDSYECTGIPDPTIPQLKLPETGYPIEQEWLDAAAQVNAETAVRRANDDWRFPDIAPYNCPIAMLHLFACDPAVGDDYYDIVHCCDEMSILDQQGCLCNQANIDVIGQTRYDNALATCSFTPSSCNVGNFHDVSEVHHEEL